MDNLWPALVAEDDDHGPHCPRPHRDRTALAKGDEPVLGERNPTPAEIREAREAALRNKKDRHAAKVEDARTKNHTGPKAKKMRKALRVRWAEYLADERAGTPTPDTDRSVDAAAECVFRDTLKNWPDSQGRTGYHPERHR